MSTSALHKYWTAGQGCHFGVPFPRTGTSVAFSFSGTGTPCAFAFLENGTLTNGTANCPTPDSRAASFYCRCGLSNYVAQFNNLLKIISLFSVIVCFIHLIIFYHNSSNRHFFSQKLLLKKNQNQYVHVAQNLI